ncbi:MAG TPA: acyltransferase [Candidatus Dwaynia gallinarum]|nr:acyltransferase [Candidatus Dwaynia gallinarum]
MMNNIKENKINLIEFNYLRAIGIFLVVLGHSFPYIDETNFKLYKYIHSLIYSFHMPLFIMISGFFAYKILTINSFKQYKLFISSKFKKLMIPYFTISFLTIPIKFILNKFSERAVVLSEVLIDIFLYPWNNPIIFFWFIYVLFLMFLFSPIVVKLNKYIVLSLFFVLSIIPMNNIQFMGITTTLKYSIFFFIGVYLRDYYMKNRNVFFNFKFKQICSIFLILIPYIIFILNINVTLNNQNPLSLTLSNFLYILKALLGIYISFVNCIIIYKFKPFKKLGFVLEKISYYSFDIYLLSWFPQIFCRIIFYQIFNLNYHLVVLISLILGFSPIIISKFILRKFNFTKKIILGIN